MREKQGKTGILAPIFALQRFGTGYVSSCNYGQLEERFRVRLNYTDRITDPPVITETLPSISWLDDETVM